ncbi:hypothetical protein AB2B38_005370 [Balneola sp. MJW-20]|uniref:hypothetical protein n=1 Tax=Gracilimonas aurantiaca TaxID=3234185 RepID=UPI0034658D31
MRNNAPVSNIKHAVEWPDGKRVYLSINANPIISKQGVTDGVFVTIDDISSRVNTGKKLELTDSGSGFDPSEAPKKSLGMELINTLFANLDAELEIRSENEFFVKATFREKISGAFGHPV